MPPSTRQHAQPSHLLREASVGPGGIQTAADDRGGSGLPLLTSWTQDRTCHLPSVPSLSTQQVPVGPGGSTARAKGRPGVDPSEQGWKVKSFLSLRSAIHGSWWALEGTAERDSDQDKGAGQTRCSLRPLLTWTLRLIGSQGWGRGGRLGRGWASPGARAALPSGQRGTASWARG